MTDDEDERLWELCGRCEFGTPGLGPDRERFEAELAFFKSLSPRIITFAMSMGLSHHDAQDINQQVFVAIAEKGLQRDKIKRRLLSYILGMARHNALTLLRERGTRFDDISEHPQLAVDFPAQGEDEENLVMARSRLNYSFQEVLTLCYDYDMTAKEAAVVLKEPVKTVETRKARALDALSRSLRFLREKNQIK